MSQEFRSVLRREHQLHALSFFLILSLVATVGFLVFVIAARIDVADLWLLRNHFLQVLIPGLLLMVIAYLADTHSRLRRRLGGMHRELELARDDLAKAYDRVIFCHHVACHVSNLQRTGVTSSVLADAVEYFGADGAVLVSGDDIEAHVVDAADQRCARSAALGAAVQVVRTGEPAVLESAFGSHTIAAPIRIAGSLESIACLWKRDAEFGQDDLEGLLLLARVMELSAENRKLVVDLRNQLCGSLGLLTTLIEDRQQDYADHAANVANLSVVVGQRLGMSRQDLEDLKLAGLVHDLGMLRVPPTALSGSRVPSLAERIALESHPTAGADLAEAAGLRPAVREAILAHHERIDGTGYPRRLHGSKIPLSARVLAVCDTYDAMTTRARGGRKLTSSEAMQAIRRLSGRAFDPEVVEAFSTATEEHVEIMAVAGIEPTHASGARIT